jgi:hypothetical protein
MRAERAVLLLAASADRFCKRPPFPHPSEASERKGSVKGARFLRGLRTLDRFLPFHNIDPEGKGARVSGGLPPGGV